MKMKVFHIISHFDLGGAERVAANIAKSHTEGFEYHVVELVRSRSPYARVFERELCDAGIYCHRGFVPDVHFHYLFERLAAFTFPLWFLPLFLRCRPAVVHCHTEMPDLAVWWFSVLFPWLMKRCKLVRTIHNTQLWTGMKRTGSRVERMFIRKGANVAISQSVRDSYERVYGQRPPVIYNGVEETARRRYDGIVEGKVNVLFAGRLEPQKGVSALIGIVKGVESMGRFHFHIIGDGSLRADVEREIGFLPCVTLRPPLNGLPAYLASFDFLLMPSEFEGLGLMSVEAGLACVPVIANRCAGLDETLPADWPLYVDNNDIGRYIEIFSNLPERAEARRLGLVARGFVKGKFGIKRMQQEYEKMYSTIFNGL